MQGLSRRFPCLRTCSKFNPSGTPKVTTGHCDFVITTFLEADTAFFLEEEDIPIESEQIDLNVERASQKHVNPDI